MANKSEPVYTNEFNKPVYKVNNLHIKKVEKPVAMSVYGTMQYEVQFNDQYFVLSSAQIQAIIAVSQLPDNISVSMG